MNIILHRRNTVNELIETPLQYGVEIDIRSYGSELVVHHDPMQKGELLTDWLKHYNHGTIILNVKEEGLEDQLIQLMKKFNIEDYFLLDQSFPFLIKWAGRLGGRAAVRFSEYESIDTVLALSGMVDWVWVDCFTKIPLTVSSVQKLGGAGFKLCVVSPELQGRSGGQEIPEYIKLIKKLNVRIDAVCTKHPDLWREIAGNG